MSAHVEDLLPDYALGDLDEPARAAVAAHLAECASCGRELADTADLLASVAYMQPLPAPSPETRERLLASVARGGRFIEFVDRIADLLDLPADRARAVLDKLDEPSTWAPLAMPGVDRVDPGVELYTPEHGPRLEGAAFGFLRLQPGARFPRHRHVGNERQFILQGGYRSSDGSQWNAGQLHEMAAGTEHDFVGLDGPPCICIGVVMNGIEMI